MITSESYLGTPFKSHGRNKEEGLDCWGLVCLIYKDEFNIKLPAWSHLYENAKCAPLKGLKEHKEAAGLWVKVDKPVHGSVALFEVGRGTHVGTMLDRTHMIHITENTVVTIEDIQRGDWSRRFRGFYNYARS